MQEYEEYPGSCKDLRHHIDSVVFVLHDETTLRPHDEGLISATAPLSYDNEVRGQFALRFMSACISSLPFFDSSASPLISRPKKLVTDLVTIGGSFRVQALLCRRQRGCDICVAEKFVKEIVQK